VNEAQPLVLLEIYWRLLEVTGDHSRDSGYYCRCFWRWMVMGQFLAITG